MLKLIARQEGLSMSFSAINTGDAIGAVENYDTDMALCIFQTSQRSKRVDFSALLHTVKVGGLILSTQSKIRAVGDLQQSSVRIAVCRGEIGHEWVTTVMRIPKRRLTILDTHDNRELAMLVESGKADIALADFITLSQYLELRETRQPAMRMVFRRDPITICSNGIAVARGQEDWANWLDQKFREIQCTPEIQKMETQTLKNYKNIIQRN
jgi:ABC-type amino acid transport substrate-binding protein